MIPPRHAAERSSALFVPTVPPPRVVKLAEANLLERKKEGGTENSIDNRGGHMETILQDREDREESSLTMGGGEVVGPKKGKGRGFVVKKERVL